LSLSESVQTTASSTTNEEEEEQDSSATKCSSPSPPPSPHVHLRRTVMKHLRDAGFNAAICKARWAHTGGFPGGDLLTTSVQTPLQHYIYIYIYMFFLASWRFKSRPPKIIAPTALLQQQQQQQASLKRVTVRLVYYSNTHLAKFMREIFSQESDTG